MMEDMPMIKPSMCRMCQAKDQRIQAMEKRLEKCEAALLKARMLLISEGDPDEDREMIVEIDEILGDAARAALEEK